MAGIESLNAETIVCGGGGGGTGGGGGEKETRLFNWSFLNFFRDSTRLHTLE